MSQQNETRVFDGTSIPVLRRIPWFSKGLIAVEIKGESEEIIRLKTEDDDFISFIELTEGENSRSFVSRGVRESEITYELTDRITRVELNAISRSLSEVGITVDL